MIDLETVRHVARLARLRLDGDEERTMQAELSDILAHVDQVQSLDLDNVPATTHVVALANGLRADEPDAELSPADALRSALAVEDGGFGVPRMG